MRKVLALLLAMLLVFSLVACSESDSDKDKDTDKTTTTATTESTTSTEDADSTTSTEDTEPDDTEPDDTDPTEPDDTDPTEDDRSTTTRRTRTTTSRTRPTTGNDTDTDGTTITTKSDFELPVTGNWEKPFTGNAAILYNEKHSQYDAEAEKLRQEILDMPDTLKPASGGKTYYVSYRGDDSNDGLSKETPWKTPSRYLTGKLQSGDVLLFERGGVYRDVSLVTKSGVSYGAYGTGAKPQLLAGDKDYADESLWKEESKNIWVTTVPEKNDLHLYRTTIEDMGNIIFDHGKVVASEGKMLKKEYLVKDYDFYFDAAKNKVYLYLSKGNPAKVHDSIEMAPNEHIILLRSVKNVVIENLCIKYTGAHGISGGQADNCTIRGCEIGWIGGGMLTQTVRYGNGIELYGEQTGNLVEKNWIYQCFDAGYTNQGEGWQKNITVQNNLMEYSVYNIEVWTVKEVGKGGLVNCTYKDNILRFAGFGFGTWRRIGSNSSVVGNISFYDYIVPCENTIITGNLLDTSFRYLTSIAFPNDTKGRGPTITGNRWHQQAFTFAATKTDIASQACVGKSKIDNATGVLYKATDLAAMTAGVNAYDTAPKSITFEK